MRRLIHILLAASLLLVVACGRTAPAVTAVVLPEGWKTVDETEFSFALPAEWEVVSAADGNVDEAMNELVRENPSLSTLADRARSSVSSGELRLFAFDLDPADMLPNFTPNLSIGLQTMEQPASLNDVAQANERELTAAGFVDVRRSILPVAGVDAARLSSTLALSGVGGEALQLAIEQVIVVREQQQYVVTFTVGAEQRERLTPIFEQLIGTFRVKDT